MSDESLFSFDEDERLPWEEALKCIKENDSFCTSINAFGDDIQNMTDEKWEQLGHDIASNIHLTELDLTYEALNDHKLSFLFRGLTRSSSITQVVLTENELSAAAVRSMVPFLQNANNLTYLHIEFNNLQTEGFTTLLRALRDSPIERLHCSCCSINPIEIDAEHSPSHLKHLHLAGNGIDANGCREIAKLLQGGDATLESLYLRNNKIDDEGVGILVDALQHNTSLNTLNLNSNVISKQGRMMVLKLLNDISSINATLQSNHTLTKVPLSLVENDPIQGSIDTVCGYNKQFDLQTDNLLRHSEAAGRMKVIQTQLHSAKRTELAEVQGVNHSLYSEIDPLHLPEVLALVGNHHGQGEFYVALKSSIAGLMSTVNRKQFLKQERARHKAIIAEHRAIIARHSAKVEAIESEIAAIEDGEDDAVDIQSESCSNKRRRV